MKKAILSLFIIFVFAGNVSANIVRVLYKSDGTVRVIIPAPNSKRVKETEKEWLNRVFSETSLNLDYVSYEDIDKSLLPGREYRNAWRGNKEEGIKVSETEKQKIINEDKIIKKQSDMKRKEAVKELVQDGELENGYE